LALPLLLGFVSLGVEVGHWYLTGRQMQGAADAAAISAGAEYVQRYNLGQQTSTTYKTVGQSYAALNGFVIPIANTCLIDPSGVDYCGSIEALDSRPVVCGTPPCVVVEITQDTFQWLSTRRSLQPNGHVGQVQGIPTPVLLARATVSVRSQLSSTTASDCILALANDPQAILVHGGGDLQAKCGIAIDGGLDQNAGTPVVGGVTFNGNNAAINVNKLNVAAPSASCPDNGTHCQLYGSTAPLPASAVTTQIATQDPYAPLIASMFQSPPPAGVSAITIVNAGSYPKNSTCTFTVTGGTFYGTSSTPAIFTAAADKNGNLTNASILDPGAYTTAGFPTGSVSASSSNCAGSGATFTLTEGCWTWNGTPIPGRKYCSINLKGSGTTNFPAGNYWIAGGDSCAGFCVSSNSATVTSDMAGVTFFLTNGEGTNAGSYATASITSGNVTLCAPGTNCGTSCVNVGPTACMLFVQNPAATVSTANGAPSSTISSFSGNGSRTLAGLIYLRNQTFQESGNGPIQGCVAVIAKYFDIGGTPIFSDGCLPGNGIGSTTVTTTLSLPHLSQ
jgi:hypothetical protein